MRVAVIGSRGVSDKYYAKLCGNIPPNCTEVVSGGANGIDRLAERYAHENNIKLTVFNPEYDKYGKKATFMRNIQIIEYSRYVIAFWNGKSKGTAYVISKCIELGVNVKIVEI